MRVVVVGPCASGKTTLVARLKELGVDAHNVAQEHSGIPTLWRKKSPDVLVMLDATLPVILGRRTVPWGEERLVIQRDRLRDARMHADLFIQTDPLSREEVAQLVMDHIRRITGNGSNNSSISEARP